MLCTKKSVNSEYWYIYFWIQHKTEIFQVLEPKYLHFNIFCDHNHFSSSRLMLLCCSSAYKMKQTENRKKTKSLSIFLVKQPIFISRFFPPSEKIVQLRSHFFSRFLSFIELKTEISYLFFWKHFSVFLLNLKDRKFQ